MSVNFPDSWSPSKKVASDDFLWKDEMYFGFFQTIIRTHDISVH